MGTVDHSVYPKTSAWLLIGACIAFFSGLTLLMSFCSPYWLESWSGTFSEFKNLGLWEFCFDHFRFPRYQFDKAFHGCHSIFSTEYLVVREWLMPGWFMFVQAMMCLALIFSLLCQVAVSIVIMRFLLKWEYVVLLTALVFSALTVITTATAVVVFGCACWDRSWLLYPNWNFLSWGYAFANVACFFFIVVTVMLGKASYTSSGYILF